MWRNKTKKQSIKIFVGFVILATLFALSFFLYYRSRSTYSSDGVSGTTKEHEQDETITYNPATEPEKKQADKVKEDIVKDQEADQPTNPDQSSDKKSVKPIITSAGQFDGQIEVRSFIPGIYESTGTCTVVFTQNNNRIERQVEGIQDATTTRCDTVTILREDFPSSGTWTVKVNYSSPSSQGESDVTSFEVQ